MGKLIRLIRLPTVTAYIIFGLLIGPDILNLVHEKLIINSPLISSIGLGLIAFHLGENFTLKNVKRMGKQVLWISILEVTGAWIMVVSALYFLTNIGFTEALYFGAIASATAPAATMMVIRECRASGLFANTLMGVVAVDDAWCLIIISLSLALAKAMAVTGGKGAIIFDALFHSIWGIAGACIIGGALIILLKKLSVFVLTREDLLIFMLGFLCIGIGMSEVLNVSFLLSCMVMGAVLSNISDNRKFFDILHEIAPPIYLLFFVLAGAGLEIKFLKTAGLVAGVYFAARIVGKMGGAYMGALVSQAPVRVRKYLGLALIPQAGVAVGAALMIKDKIGPGGDIIFTIIIATTVVYELIGPLCTKIALKKAGEIL